MQHFFVCSDALESPFSNGSFIRIAIQCTVEPGQSEVALVALILNHWLTLFNYNGLTLTRTQVQLIVNG